MPVGILRNATYLLGSSSSSWAIYSRLVQRSFSLRKLDLVAPSLTNQNNSFPSLGKITANCKEMSTTACSKNEDRKTQIQPAVDLLEELKSLKNASGLSVESKAVTFCATYKSLTADDKAEVLRHLSLMWASQQGLAVKTAQGFIDSCKGSNEEGILKAEEKLRETLDADVLWIVSSLARVEGGIKFLIDLRADILHLLSEETSRFSTAGLKALGNAIKNLLTPCFAWDMLQLERVTWLSPGDLLQKVSEGEAVHPIRSWADLKRRLGPYRRCFVLSHPALPLQPVAVLHVALTNQIPASIHNFVPRGLAVCNGEAAETNQNAASFGLHEDMNNVDTAIFYSISSTQKGLAGIDLGQCLIKRAVRRLQEELPNVHHFSTLSPIPGFRSWLLYQLREAERGTRDVLTKQETQQLCALLSAESSDVVNEFRKLIVSNSWIRDEKIAGSLENVLMRLCAFYLYGEKRRNYALDSVANFHLRNGAVMWRLNWMADLSPRGLSNSCGMMVNYRYYLEICEDNSRRYIKDFHVKAADQIRQLANPSFSKTSHL